MWSFGSNATAGGSGQKNDSPKHSQAGSECSDDEVSSNTSREEGLECPICCESFNIVENVPYVLWCGHTLCKNCILALQWAVVKFPTLPIQLPLFISCPWCHLLSFRLVYKGNLKFPRKNFFLLWMVESLNGDRVKSHSHSHSSFSGNHQPVWPSNNSSFLGSQVNPVNSRRVPHTNHQEQLRPDPDHVSIVSSYLSMENLHSSLRKSLVFFVNITAKFPLVVVFLLIILYAVPASAAILVLYILVTVLFAFPSFLILCFAYPSLDWLVREIIT
ncbi:zinc finger protein [Macleaya cordata]|uniref:Zinc finger protein n=1 Tax=Macleaya cordata TaxID=56857 RepID=A0A200PR86_MACCD|nr:zinc finger protein [Macleaya cordata]